MDRLDKLLRGANPVPEDAEPPHPPPMYFREMQRLLPAEPWIAGTWQASARPYRPPYRKLQPAVALLAATVLAAMGVLAALFFLPVRNPAPITPPTAEPSASDDWRLASFSPNAERWPETVVHLRIPPGWRFDTAPGDPSPGDPDYPAASGYLHVGTEPDVLQSYPYVTAMLYYGPIGRRYDPGACLGPAETYTELDSLPVAIPFDATAAGTVPPRFVYRVVDVAGGRLAPSFGITTRAPGSSTDACHQYFQIRAERPGFYFMFSSYTGLSGDPPGWLKPYPLPLVPEFSTMEEARAFMDKPEYQVMKRVFTSITITVP